MKRKHKEKPKLKKQIALERISVLFSEAAAQDDLLLADKYVALARRLAMKAKIKMPSQYRRQYCKHCYSYMKPGATCRVRTTGKTISYFCLKCKKFTRFRYK